MIGYVILFGLLLISPHVALDIFLLTAMVYWRMIREARSSTQNNLFN
jgi:hypothetical protein